MTVALIVRDGSNTPRTITGLLVRDGTNTQRTITAMYVRDTNNVSRLVFNPGGSATLSVTVAPPIVSGTTSGTGTATTGDATATATGGTAPYTYAWTLLTHSAGTPPTADTSTMASTTFTQTGIAPYSSEDATWKCTVTDANANTADSDPNTSIFVDISP